MDSLPDIFELFCDYKQTLEGNTPRTIHWYKTSFKQFLKHTQIEDPQQFTRLRIEQWLHQCKKERNWASRTVRQKIQLFRIFLDWTVDRGIHDRNWARDMKLPKIRHKTRPRLSREEALSLLDWTTRCPFQTRFERVRAVTIIAILLFTGVRRAELLNLELQDIRFDTSNIHVRCGKNEKDRIIPIVPKLRVFLQRYLDEREKLNYMNKRLIVSAKSDRPLNVRCLTRLLKRIKEYSHIQFSPHMLRHTFATLMIEGGANIYSLSRILGHSQITTTTIYLQATTHMLESDMAKFPL